VVKGFLFVNEVLKRISPFTMVLFIIAIQFIALLLANPFQSLDIKAFNNPQSVWNPLYYVLLILVFTAFLLLIIRLGKRWVIQVIIGLVIISTLYFVYSSVLLSLDSGWLIAIAATAVTAFFLFYYPEWYVIDLVGILIGAGAAAIFGISFAVLPEIGRAHV
jgi:presenilin-like A22 family membrane protease